MKHLLLQAMMVIFMLCALDSCNTSNSFFGKKSPHETYQDQIEKAGLDKTILGRQWIAAAQQSLEDSAGVDLPFREIGYFAAEKPAATAYVFNVKHGQKITVYFELKSVDTATLFFAELWNVSDNKKKMIAALKSPQDTLEQTARSDGKFLVRVQPELLRSVEYTITITDGPSLAFPVDKSGNPKLISYWGAGRDAGARKHEGVDIRADFRTPALAAADGYVARAGNNQLGGKIIFLRDAETGNNLYYAHLDSQIAKQGQTVKVGDTLGLVGKTGNAINTVPHLHFGIYTSGGAIDPINFIRPQKADPPKISVSLDYLNKWVHSVKNSDVYQTPSTQSAKISAVQKGEVAFVNGASKSWYHIELPGGQTGYVTAKDISDQWVTNTTFDSGKTLLVFPSTTAPGKSYIQKGHRVAVAGKYQNFLLVNVNGLYGWIEN